MMIGKDAVARSVRVGPLALGNDGVLDLDARKRRIIRRGAMGNGASVASQNALAEAGTIQRVAKGRPLISQGEPTSSVAMIGMGRVRITRALGDTRTLSIGYRGEIGRASCRERV